jgi:hypothetical protein
MSSTYSVVFIYLIQGKKKNKNNVFSTIFIYTYFSILSIYLIDDEKIWWWCLFRFLFSDRRDIFTYFKTNENIIIILVLSFFYSRTFSFPYSYNICSLVVKFCLKTILVFIHMIIIWSTKKTFHPVSKKNKIDFIFRTILHSLFCLM